MQLDIISIFKSIDGEVNAFYQGRTTTFVRFAKCNCRCFYCDTAFSFKSGKYMYLNEVVNEISKFNSKKVTITGGEPLLQLEGFLKLVTELIHRKYNVSVETNGSIVIPKELLNNIFISWVVDYKLKSSGQSNKMTFDAFTDLTSTDFVKFVIADEDDFKEALSVRHILETSHNCKANFCYAPLHGGMNPQDLYNLLDSYGKGDEIINLQLHKYIWPDCGVNEER